MTVAASPIDDDWILRSDISGKENGHSRYVPVCVSRPGSGTE
jgi:hypothetical protein